MAWPKTSVGEKTFKLSGGIDGPSNKQGKSMPVKLKDLNEAAVAEKETELDREIRTFYNPLEVKTIKLGPLADGHRVWIVNDIHFPFHDGSALALIERFMDDFQPDTEVYNGDICDFYEASRFDTNPSRLKTLQDEIDLTVAWLKRRKKRNPKARRVYLEGNHEDRLRRFLWSDARKLSSLRELNFRSLFKLDDIECQNACYRSKLNILGFMVEHGYRASMSAAFPANVARLMAVATGSSGLCGHDHRTQSYSWSDSRGGHTYINNGCVCKLTQEYAPAPNWQHGFTYGVVCAGKLQVKEVRLYPSGFWAEGKFYAPKKA